MPQSRDADFRRYITTEAEAICHDKGVIDKRIRTSKGYNNDKFWLQWIERHSAKYRENWEASKCKDCGRSCRWRCAHQPVKTCSKYIPMERQGEDESNESGSG